MNTVEVIAEKLSTVTFPVRNGTRPEIENAIADRLRSETQLVWIDSPNGIRVVCLSPNGVWRPRRRFFLTDDGNPPLLIEGKSEPRPNGEGEK
jgi:hypothetical protein